MSALTGDGVQSVFLSSFWQLPPLTNVRILSISSPVDENIRSPPLPSYPRTHFGAARHVHAQRLIDAADAVNSSTQKTFLLLQLQFKKFNSNSKIFYQSLAGNSFVAAVTLTIRS